MKGPLIGRMRNGVGKLRSPVNEIVERCFEEFKHHNDNSLITMNFDLSGREQISNADRKISLLMWASWIYIVYHIGMTKISVKINLKIYTIWMECLLELIVRMLPNLYYPPPPVWPYLWSCLSRLDSEQFAWWLVWPLCGLYSTGQWSPMRVVEVYCNCSLRSLLSTQGVVLHQDVE